MAIDMLQVFIYRDSNFDQDAFNMHALEHTNWKHLFTESFNQC